MIFNKYPYTDFHEMNLDWLIKKMKELEQEWVNFIAGNSLHLADPITHDLTSTYAKNTIVISQSGDVYVSIQPVPVGVQISNNDYWMLVFNYEAFVDRVCRNFTDNYYRNSNIAVADIATGEWLVIDDVLFKAIDDIETGDNFVIDTNITHFTLEDFLDDFTTAATNLIIQYKHDIDASEVLYRNQLAGDIANTTQSLQTQLDNAISGVTVDSEVINARVGLDGVTYSTLRSAMVGQLTKILIRDYVSFTVQVNLANAVIEETSSGVYLKLSGSWYLRNGLSVSTAYADVLPNDHITSPGGVSDCILIPNGSALVWNRTTSQYAIYTYDSSNPIPMDYIPIFITGVAPQYGGTRHTVVGGVGLGFFRRVQNFLLQTIVNANNMRKDVIFSASPNIVTGVHFEETNGYVYIKITGNWYLKNGLNVSTAYSSILTGNRDTSPSGVADCIKLPNGSMIAYNLSTSAYEIVTQNDYTINNARDYHYIPIFMTGTLSYGGSTHHGVIGGVGFPYYSHYIEQQLKLADKTWYGVEYWIDGGVADVHRCWNIADRSDGQDIAVYNGTVFSIDEDTCTVNGTTFAINSGHGNTAMFGTEIHTGDDFPYLYCGAWSTGDPYVYVNRVTTSGATLVDTITLADVTYHSSIAIDEDNERIYALVSTVSNPDAADDILFNVYDLTGTKLSSVNIGSLPTIQGMTFHDDRIYVLSGYGGSAKLTIFDTSGNIVGRSVQFGEHFNAQEPEGIDIDQVTHVMYLATRHKIIH